MILLYGNKRERSRIYTTKNGQREIYVVVKFIYGYYLSASTRRPMKYPAAPPTTTPIAIHSTEPCVPK